jgi:pSer/pThr/pTyr-binding forkhead associated (FHA) protein
MDVKLVVAKGKHKGKELPVARPKFMIGRAKDCQLRPLSDAVSRHHCAIVVEDGGVNVRDYGSKNGTFVNGDRVVGKRELKNGDRLKICELEFDVQLNVGVSGKNKPKVQSVQQAAARTVESGEEDLNLDRWLRDTQSSEPGEESDTVAAPPEAAESLGEQSKESEKPSDVVGVWKSGRWKPTTASPRDAAADTLKNLFKRQ